MTYHSIKITVDTVADYSIHQRNPSCEATGEFGLLAFPFKLTKQEQTKTLRETRAALADFGEQITVQMFSSLKKIGVEEVEKVVGGWLAPVSSVSSKG